MGNAFTVGHAPQSNQGGGAWELIDTSTNQITDGHSKTLFTAYDIPSSKYCMGLVHYTTDKSIKLIGSSSTYDYSSFVLYCSVDEYKINDSIDQYPNVRIVEILFRSTDGYGYTYTINPLDVWIPITSIVDTCISNSTTSHTATYEVQLDNSSTKLCVCYYNNFTNAFTQRDTITFTREIYGMPKPS